MTIQNWTRIFAGLSAAALLGAPGQAFAGHAAPGYYSPTPAAATVTQTRRGSLTIKRVAPPTLRVPCAEYKALTGLDMCYVQADVVLEQSRYEALMREKRGQRCAQAVSAHFVRASTSRGSDSNERCRGGDDRFTAQRHVDTQRCRTDTRACTTEVRTIRRTMPIVRTSYSQR